MLLKGSYSMIVQFFGAGVRAVVVAVSVLGVATAASAEDPSPNAVAIAKEIIEIKGGTELYTPVVPALIEQAKGLFLQTNPTLQAPLNEVAAKLRKEFEPESAEMVNDAAKIYAAAFTEEELKQVLAFYKSPLGRKIIEEEPRILEKSRQNVQQMAERLSDKVISRMRVEMKKMGHDI
jgi:hypothetical protein